MKTLITGANGMLARAAIRHCRESGDDVVALSRADLDIAKHDAVVAAFERERPEIVLNCAAYTNVDGAETNIEQCYAANAEGPENLSYAGREFGAVLVTISTDYVFDGEKDGFYTESDAPNPQSVYAKSKFEGEQRVLSANENAIVIRSGWIYGRDGTNFLSKVRELLEQGTQITAITDSYGTPTFAGDLAARMRELAALKATGIFHVTNSGPGASYYEFASAVAEICGFDSALIQPVSNDSLQRPAARPTNARLASVRDHEFHLAPLRNWTSALSEYLG